MNSWDELMAKSLDPGFPHEQLTLCGHSLRVYGAAEAILSVLDADICDAMNLSEEEWFDFQRNVRLAALLHDLGKCSESFQNGVHESSKDKHVFLHENLSVFALASPDVLGAQLEDVLGKDTVRFIALTILGHHLRVTSENKAHTTRTLAPNEFLHMGHRDLIPVYTKLSEIVGTELTVPGSRMYDTKQISRELRLFMRGVQESIPEETRPLLSLARGLLIAADVVGSSYDRADDNVASWIHEALGLESLRTSQIDRLVADKLGSHTPMPFQDEVARSRSRVTLVTAGCGNGKTLAAYMWARHHACDKKLAFCYPTTGTTSAGFKDYLFAQTDLERQLLHGRARVDAHDMTLADSSSTEGDIDPLSLWAADVLDSWGTRVIACTVDSVLGMMAYSRAGLARAPLWIRSAIVFDEIHSYDERMFEALCDFLAHIRVPTLLMTASLSSRRLDALRAASRTELVPIRGEPTIERAKRYTLTREHSTMLTPEDALNPRVSEALETHEGKTLVVCNTVIRAQKTARRLRVAFPNTIILLYHSRFRYEDRVARQREVLAAFKEEGSVIVVSTQVCEMSLDLSADLLLTELCPFDSMVQRLGRLNRRDRTPTTTRRCVIFDVPTPAPYAREVLASSNERLSEWNELDLSQQDLADEMVQLEEALPHDQNLPFVRELELPHPQGLRVPSYGVTILRAEELSTMGPRTRDALLRNQIPMPPMPARLGRIHDLRRFRRHTPITRAGDVIYSVQEGAAWK